MHMNLSKYKKIASDKHSSTFRHSDGHEMKIVHKALSRGMRKQVDAIPMAEGGYVDTVDSGDPIAKAIKKPKDPDPEHEGRDWSSQPTQSPKDPSEEKYKQSVKDFNAKTAQPMADGGEVKDVDYQKLPETAAPQQAPVTINIGQPSAPEAQAAPTADQDVPIGQRIGHAVGEQISGAAQGALHNPFNPLSQLAGVAQVGGELLQGGVQGAAGQPLAPIPSMDQAPQGPSPASVPNAGLAPPSASNGVSTPVAPGTKPNNPYQTALAEQVKGLELGEKAQEIAAKGKEQALGAYNKAQQQAANTYDANIKDAMGLRQQAMEALQGAKIDPDRYWHNKSTGGQIASILGIIAAGFNPGHNPNAAIEMLNKSIDRDMEAQRMDIGKKQNLLSAANDHFKNIQSAADFHRVMANDLVSHKIDEALAKAGTPAAQAELMKARGALKFDSEMRMAQIGAMQTLNGSASPDEQAKALNTLRLTAPEKAKEYEQRIIPGVGTAQVPVPEKKREAFAAAATFMSQMDALEKFREAHRGTVLDRGIVDEGHRLAELARNSFRIAQGEGVFKEGSAKFNERLIPDPTDMDAFSKNKAAYSAMKDQAGHEVQNSMKVYGIKPSSDSLFAEGANLSAQEKSFLDWAKRNPNTPEAKKVFKKLGINH